MGVRLYELTGLRTEMEWQYGHLLSRIAILEAQHDAMHETVFPKPKPKKWWQVWR